MMKQKPSWYHDEFRQVGTDYDDPAQVEAYDARHAQFRDVDAECDGILGMLDVTPQSVLIELGTGTGAFAIHAARRCKKVYAADVSRPMLDFARQKAAHAGLGNIVFCHGGFLTYEHKGVHADTLVTCMALHHLPDFWKGIALGRMNSMLKIGGQLYLSDVVFAETDVAVNIPRWIDHLGEMGGAQLRDEIAAHIREEYSTFDWIMRGLLTRAGFKIHSEDIQEGVIGKYLCVKETETAQ
jgi:putative AdoMet-dependent methyltransferase